MPRLDVPARRRAISLHADIQRDRDRLLPQAKCLPDQPGVYLFHAESGRVPVYIGKSVNLRSRVLAHLRNAEEADMLRQTHRISAIPTAGELGALLLEAQLIKREQPLRNQKLRRYRQLCALRWDPQGLEPGPSVAYSTELDFANTAGLFGLFSSRTAALERLRALATEHRLCDSALGLEKTRAGRACFRASLRQCAGWCCGRETDASHRARLLEALEPLRVAVWPYPGAIALEESHPQVGTQLHVVRHWQYLGTVSRVEDAATLMHAAPKFDMDSYRLLVGPILGGDWPLKILNACAT